MIQCQSIGSRAPRSTIHRVQEICRSGAGHPRQVRRQGSGARRALSEKFQRFVVIEFPTFEQGGVCFTSDEYSKAAAFRDSGAGEVETVILDGFETPR